MPGLFVALIEKVCIADYQLGWQDFVAYNFQNQRSDDFEDKDDGDNDDDVDDPNGDANDH